MIRLEPVIDSPLEFVATDITNFVPINLLRAKFQTSITPKMHSSGTHESA